MVGIRYVLASALVPASRRVIIALLRLASAGSPSACCQQIAFEHYSGSCRLFSLHCKQSLVPTAGLVFVASLPAAASPDRTFVIRAGQRQT